MTNQYRDLLDVWIKNCEQRGIDLTIKPYERLGWKAVHDDLTSHGGFQWPGPGGRVTSRGSKKGGPCPSFVGDGFCIAKTAHGAASGGIPLHTLLVLAYDSRGVLGSDTNKIRVRSARVLAVVDGWRADLRGADLQGANLRGADLRGANLREADLWEADLRGAVGDTRCQRIRNGKLVA